MKKWVLIEVKGMGEKTKRNISLEISNRNVLSTDEAIGYLADQ